MPNINLIPTTQSNGDKVISFIDVANIQSQDFNLNNTYNKLDIYNGNNGVLTVTVNGTVITINPYGKGSYSGDFTVFSIQSSVDSNEFTANCTIDEKDLYSRLDEFDTQLADMASFINVPDGFSWVDNPLVKTLFKDFNGEYKTSYDISANQSTGKTYYVHSSTGNDSNDGLTVNTPLQSMLAAYNKPDIKVMVLCHRRFNYLYGMKGTPIDKDITIKSLFNTHAIIGDHPALTWNKTATATNVYETTLASATLVIDVSRKDESGNFLQLASATSIADCDAKVDSCFISGSTVYAHVSGNSTPSYNIYAVRNDIDTLTCSLTSGHKVYLENIDVVGGFSATGTGNVYAKNCTFQYGRYASSYRIDSSILSIVKNCIAAKASNDGFCYTNGARGIEINCIGRNNGDGVGDNDNGSTSHSGCKVIRVNGQYYKNYGPNIADVQTDTESWNLGCISHDSLGVTGGQQSDFNAVQNNIHMWLDGCIGYNSAYTIYTQDAAQMHTRDCQFETYQMNTGTTIDEY